MKKLILLFCFVLIVSPRVYSQILFEENFEYPAGDTLKKYWRSISPLGLPDPIRISSPSLTFPYYLGSGVGNAAKLDTFSSDAVSEIFSFGGVSTGSLYVSFLVNVFSAREKGDYFMGITEAISLSNVRLRVHIKELSDNIAFGISKTHDAPIYTPAQYLKNTTYLLILKYTFNPGPLNDPISLFVFSSPPPSIEPPPTLGPTAGIAPDMNSAFAIDLFQSNNSLGLFIDGIHIIESWHNSILPIELSGFTATVNNRDVVLNWSTSSELNNSGFDIERCDGESIIQTVWTKLGFAEGNGTSVNYHEYSFTDKDLNAGSYKYRLKQIDLNGNFQYYDLQTEIIIGVPDKFSLSQNYPNPFNPSTVIRYSLTQSGFTSLKIFNSLGKEVATLVNQKQNAGTYEAEFDNENLSSGIYFYTLSTPGFTDTKRMTHIK
ncbi:MAG: T9SS type A sorting domain-containing protein [Ignavibacteria bacterium]|nr:T9SS type A sorting domain-containing protein [Ignavibacteria bacterium]